MKGKILTLFFLCIYLTNISSSHAQGRQLEMYGDSVKESKMKYVNSLEEAQRLAYQKKKMIFFNCYADWAAPCWGMDQYVFSDQEFANYMDKTFINLCINMNTPKGKEIAKEYGVNSYAYYLILNYKGEVIQRISGGIKLPEFKERVKLALNPKTSLAGAREKYKSGKYSKKDLYNYLNALHVAGEDSLFKRLGKEYMAMLTEKEYSEKKNWIFARLCKDRKGEYYKYLIKNKPLFVKEIGEKQVNGYIESLFASEILGYATGDTEYDIKKMNKLYEEIQEAALPDTCLISIVYNVAKLRGERKFHDLLQYMEDNGHYFLQQAGIRAVIELSFNFEGINENEKTELITYLQNAAKREKGSNSKRLNKLASVISEGNKGIEFEHISFNELLLKAKKQDKLIFMDCYTSWCGPCRAMTNTVFTRPEIGSYFNSHFINTKIDMEKGEGIELARKYRIKAYPTLLFLDMNGNVIETLVGYKNPEQLMEAVQKLQGK